MAGTGRTKCFHGAFASKEKALQKQADTPGSFIQEIMVRGKVRYNVVTDRKEHPGRDCSVRVRL